MEIEVKTTTKGKPIAHVGKNSGNVYFSEFGGTRVIKLSSAGVVVTSGNKDFNNADLYEPLYAGDLITIKL